MAIGLENYPNISAPDSDYLHGNIKDDSGANDGTPLNKFVHADYHQFFRKLLADASVPPNGLPENEYSGHQYNTSLAALINKYNPNLIFKKLIPIGAWDMTGGSSVSVPFSINPSKLIRISVTINDDSFTTAVDLSAPADNSFSSSGAIVSVGNTGITLQAKVSGFFDGSSFNDLSINRGYIVYEYIL